MKKKLLVLLSSVVAGVGLVGATFAAWAVTDSADPLGIKISPSAISESTDTFSTMHLQWGDKTQFTNIAGLELGKTRVVSLGVKSTVNAVSGDTATGGNLSIELADYTKAEDIVVGAPRLYQNIEVKVYETKTTGENPTYEDEIEELRVGGTTLSANHNISTDAEGAEKTLYFTVSIKSGVTAAQYNQMQKDVVYLLADWNKPTGIKEVSVDTYYFQADTTHNQTPYAYAYKESNTGLSKNANFPGVPMTVYNSSNRIYSVELEKNKFDHIIFSYGNTGLDQTADLTLPATTTPLYNGSWVANTHAKDVVEPQYYLVGNISNWEAQDTYKLTKSGDVYTINITVPSDGLVYKIKETTMNVWYSYTTTEDGSENCTWNTGGNNIVVTFDPAGPTYVNAELAA